jgi:LPXTG-motif cell wall-anchored protein
MGLTESSFTVTSDNYSNIKVAVTDGYLDITPVTDEVVVNITGNHDSKVYTGSVQSVSGYTTDVNDKAINVSLNKAGTDVATGTDVNHYVMGLTESSFTVTSDNYSNIKVAVTDGYLDITPVTDEVVVKIVGDTLNNVYTGKEQGVQAFNVTNVSNLLYSGSDMSVPEKHLALRTDVGTSYMGLTDGSFTNISKNFSNVRFEVTDGYVNITQAKVKVIANKNGKEYGNADPKFSANVIGLVDNENPELIKYSVTRLNVGTEEAVGTYTGAIVATGEASQGNYSVSYVPADFTIVASNENAVFATGYTGTYDGSAHSITAKAAQNGSTMYYSTDNQTWSETLPEYTDAAETRTVYVKAVNSNYEDALGQAEVTINKRNVTLTSGTSSKRYDGSALTNENVTVSGDGFVTGEGAVYTVTGTQTEVGTSENAFTYAMNAETKADNYNVTVVNGTLTVTERPVTPITPDEPDQPVTPATPETPARPTTPTTTDRPHTPNTGDQTNAGMAAGVFGFSILAAALAIFFKKKYSE